MSKSFESEKSVGILSLIGNLHQPLRKLFKLLDFPCCWCCIYNCTYSKRAFWMLALHVFGEATEQRDCSRTSKYRTSWTKFLQSNTHKFVSSYWRGSKSLKDHVKYEILNLVNEEGINVKWGEVLEKIPNFCEGAPLEWLNNDWEKTVPVCWLFFHILSLLVRENACDAPMS